MRAPIDEVDQAQNEELFWGIHWSLRGHIPDGTTISTATWSRVDESGQESTPALQIDQDSIQNGVETWVRCRTPTPGVSYLVTCLATTSGGEKCELSLRLTGV